MAERAGTARPAADASRWQGLEGLIATGIALGLAELARTVLDLPDLVAVTLLIASLTGVALAGLRGGALPATLAAVLVAVYTIHYVSTRTPFDVTGQTLASALVMLVIGLIMGLSMALIKRREDALKGELRAKADALEERNRELRDANEVLEAFTYVVSHDLKEPVRAIENYIEATEQEWGTPEGRTFLAKAHQANERLITLLRGLLEYSRTNLTATAPQPLRLGAVVDSEACRTMFETLLDERGATLEVEELPVVTGDDVVLAQLFGNLILNAIKHHRGDGPPRIVVREIPPTRPGFAHVAVDDNGPGFPDEVVRRFGQLKGTRPSTVRGGFGLTISQRAAQRLGGRMWLDRSPEGGARVHVELPGAGPLAASPERILPQGRQ